MNIVNYLVCRFSKTKVDFTVVKIKLVSRDGVLKDSTECAPTGHFFVPTYDKGSFFLEIEGPSGWNFGMISPLSLLFPEFACHPLSLFLHLLSFSPKFCTSRLVSINHFYFVSSFLLNRTKPHPCNN